MSKYLRISFLTLLLLLFATVSMAGNVKKKNNNKRQEYIYIEKGMRHHLVLMNKYDKKLGKVVAGIIDTIQHANVSDPAEPWDEGIQQFVQAGDTVANYYALASDTAKILEIHASFATTGIGKWNVWESPINTAKSFLLIDVPWTITDADTNGSGVPTGNWQINDLDEQGLAANITGGEAYVGYYTDESNGPFMFMDNGGHDFDDASWRAALAYLRPPSVPAAETGWYFWWIESLRTYTEYVQRIVVFYEKVAPISTIKTKIPDYFAGNPAYPTVEAEIIDLDGTVASANLNFTVGASGNKQTVAMSATTGDLWSGNFNATFNGGDTLFYWIDATDDGGNNSESGSKTFLVIEPPAKGTNVLYVSESGNVDDVVFTDALSKLSKDYFMWNIDVHGGISSYEINWGFDNIIWYGFGASSLPSPFETGDHAVKDYLDAGGHLMIIDNDYLFHNGYQDSVLHTGQFGYDYLGLLEAISDPAFDDPTASDTVFAGVAADAIGGEFADPDSIITFPDTWGTWVVNADPPFATDWQDMLIPNENASPTFYNDYLGLFGYHSAIRNDNGSFATAFFAFGVETADAADFEAVLANTLDWFGTVTSLEDENYLVSDFSLAQNYPNPFNPSTRIDFYLKNAQKVKIEVFNTLGQKVALLTNNEYQAGKHSVDWNSVDLKNNLVATGIYYYKLSAGEFTSIKKMVLIK